jgi:hypothetical protein
MYYYGGRMCPIAKLRLHDDDCDKNTHEMWEDYAKIALLMIYLFRKLEDIQHDESYWKLFHRELQMITHHKVTTVWLKGFEILRNIEHRHSMQHDTPKQTLLLKIPTTNLIQKGNL